MQCSLKYDKHSKKWEGSKRGKIPKNSRNIFNKLLEDIDIYDNELPPFINKFLTYNEWLKIKKSTTMWNDKYYDIPNDTISKMYSHKKCHYIQIKDYGLYHLGNDICNFNVPEFIIEQQLRIRIKVHKTKTKKGYCSLSITASCKPKNIKSLKKSLYSLDNPLTLPENLLLKHPKKPRTLMRGGVIWK